MTTRDGVQGLTETEQRDLTYHEWCRKVGAANGWTLHGSSFGDGASFYAGRSKIDVPDVALKALEKKDSDHRAEVLRELRALTREVCWRCKRHDKFSDSEPSGFDGTNHYHHRSGQTSLICDASAIHARIAQIEKEI